MDESISLLSALVSIDSTTGAEGDLALFISSWLLDKGFRVDKIPSGAVVGIIEGGAEGPTLVVDAHFDAVPVGERKWEHDPFAAEIIDGVMYGRGTSDMKGGAAAGMVACSRFIGRKFPGRIIVALVPEEEHFEGIVSLEVAKSYKPDYVIITESTELKLSIGQRGRAEVVIESHGYAGHSSRPDKGRNAIYEMMRALEALREVEVQKDEILGEAFFVPTDIKSTPYPGLSVMPERVSLTLDRRLLPRESEESVLVPLNRAFKEKDIDAKCFIVDGKTTTYTGHHLEAKRFFPAWKEREDSPIVEKARKALEEKGIFKGYTHYGFCTNGSAYGGILALPVIGYGPGREEDAHTIDESIEVSQVTEATEGTEAIIKGLLGI